MQASSHTSMAVTAFDTGIRALIKEITNKLKILSFSRCKVEHVDEDQTKGDKKHNPCWDNILNKIITCHDTLAYDDD
jgi:hypothetical protein